MLIFAPIALFIVTMILLIVWRRSRAAKRADYIRTYMFPPGLIDKLNERHPTLALKDRQLVARALRQYFLAYHKSGYQYVAMPSQIVDDLWHEFILYTQTYQIFCQQAFGRFFHHTPAAALGPQHMSNSSLRRTWWHACIEENINPRRATRLPLLFALDAKFDVPNGFRYQVDCRELRKDGNGGVYCGGDFYGGDGGSTSFDFGDGGSTHHSGTSDGDSGGNSDSSGCSGGCGGGCGGGGD